jgi:serine/threonine-protein kinase
VSAAPSGRQGTGDEEAYEHYLRGHYFWTRRGTTALLEAIDEYRAATARDTGFARAWAGMAMSYAVLRSYTPLNADSVNDLAIAAARRALALDSTVTDAHLALASGLSNRLDLAAAEAEYRRVLALAPNDPTAHQWLGANLNGQGRVAEAVPELQRAAALDPLSAVIASDEALALLAARRYPEAIAAARRSLRLDPSFTYAHANLAQIYGVTGHDDSALAELGLEPPGDERTTWRGSGWRGMAAWVYGKAGRHEDAERMRREIARDPSATGYDIAMAALAAGDLRAAVAGLTRSFERHEILSDDESPGCDPVFDPLHQLPGYRALMGRYGIRICQ